MPHQPTASARRCRADRARQVAAVLRRQVLEELPGGLLPSEAELAAEFSTTRNAVREALDLLRTEGLVERRQGLGTYVVSSKHPHGLDRLQGLAETFEGRGVVRNEVRTVSVVRAPRAVADRLRLSEGDDVVYVERLRHLDDDPVSLDLTYLVPELGVPLIGEDLTCNDIFALLEQLADQPLGRADLVLEAATADPHSATALATHRGAPLLLLERLTHLGDGRPVDLEYIRFRGDRVNLRGTVQRLPKEEL